MSQPVCPACTGNVVERREFVDVAEQHKLYAPDDEKTQLDLTDAAFESTSSYQVLRCRNCGLEFCNPLSAPSSAWYRLVYRTLNLYSLKRWEYDEVLRRIPKGSHVFEFGCGSGTFLMRCLQYGMMASGMDFSEDGVGSCVAKGLAVRRIDLDESAVAEDADRVSQLAAFHFLEHLDRPAALFEHASARALPSAHLWVSVPADRRAERRFGVRDYLDQPPHHMTRWTMGAFREIGKRNGWRLLETLYEPVPLRAALWAITAYSPGYRRWKEMGRFQSRLIERAYRAASLPTALIRRLGKDRQLSGFAMLAHFVFDIPFASADGGQG